MESNRLKNESEGVYMQRKSRCLGESRESQSLGQEHSVQTFRVPEDALCIQITMEIESQGN